MKAYRATGTSSSLNYKILTLGLWESPVGYRERQVVKQNSWRRPSWVFPNAFQYKTWQPAAAKNSFYAAIDCFLFLPTFMSGHPTDSDTAPTSGSLTRIYRERCRLKTPNKTAGNAVSFLFSLEDGSAASTSSFPLPACHEPPLTERVHPGGLQGAPKAKDNFLLLER